MSRLIYKGTGRVGGTVVPMDEVDSYFWANRHRAEQDRLARVRNREKQRVES